MNIFETSVSPKSNYSIRVFVQFLCRSAGYGKVPEYELLFTDYLVDLARRKGKKLGSEVAELDFEECPSAS